MLLYYDVSAAMPLIGCFHADASRAIDAAATLPRFSTLYAARYAIAAFADFAARAAIFFFSSFFMLFYCCRCR